MGKQYTTAPLLYNKEGDPIPQYLDVTDTTDSPQGTFKPITSLQDVSVSNFPATQDVQVKGRNVEKIFAFNALAITTTSNQLSPLLDLTKYKEVIFIVNSTLDQPVKLSPRFGGSTTTRTWDESSGTWKAYANLTGNRFAEIPVTSGNYILSSFFPEFIDFPIESMEWRATCDTSPTSGSLTLEIWGVIN